METLAKEKKKRVPQMTPYPKINVNQATYARLKRLAKSEGKTLIASLDSLSQLYMPVVVDDEFLGLEMTPTPQQAVMEALSGLRRDLSGIGRDLDYVKNYVAEKVKENGDKPQ